MTTPPPHRCAARNFGSKPCPPNRAMNSVKLMITEKQISPWMISMAQRVRPPIKSARMELPMTALEVPRNICVILTVFPDFSTARGVAEETASTLKVVTVLLKEISTKQRPARAGLIKFLPRPPKQHLATPTPNSAPMMGIYTGTVGGRDRASRRPVTTALPSLMV